MSRFIHGARALLRRLARRPGFALAVLITLALGIGANTATFELLHGYLLAPLPYAHEERLVNLYFTSPKLPGNLRMSYSTYFDLRAQAPAIAEGGMFNLQQLNLVSGTQVVHARGAEISASLLTTLGVPPELGRFFGPEADKTGATPQVLISDRLWSRLFNRDSGAVGKLVRVNDTAYAVAGVMPGRFQFPDPDTDLWLAKIFGPHEYAADNLTAFSDTLIVRLAPGATLGQLAAQAQAVLEREIVHFPVASAIPIFRGMELRMVASPLRNLLLADLGERLLLAQLATLLLLLLIWFNLANLFIARALRHRGELVLRRVLGAETHVLFRQLLAESLTLCLAGGAAGLLLGKVLVRVLLQAGLASSALPPPAGEAYLMPGIALLLAVLSALVFALVGLYFIRRQDLAQALKEADARSAGGRGERRIRAALVVTQLTLACVLTTIGAMLAHSLMRLGVVDLGFASQNLVTFQVHVPLSGNHPESVLKQQLARLHGELTTLPGLTGLTIASDLPFDGTLGNETAYPYPFDGKHTPPVVAVVTDADYFRTFAIPLHQGRLPQAGAGSGEHDAVVDVRAAQNLFGSSEVVGRELTLNSPNDSRPSLRFRISGVVGDTRRAYVNAGNGIGSLYVDRDQVFETPDSGRYWASDTWYVVSRTPLETAAVLPTLTRAVSRALPGVPLYDVHTMTERLSQQLAPRRGLTTLVLVFALGALAVAAVGLYAVASYAVGQRRTELGIRAALGADPGRLRGLVLREVAGQLLIGAPLGIAGAVILGRLFSDSLQGVESADLASLGLVLLVLTATTTLAGWTPAWRASRVSPVEALREGP
jgi:predicted permease